MTRRYRVLVAAALLLSLATLSALASVTLLRPSNEPENAVLLPTACENLVAATELLAERGSISTLPMTDPDVFSGDPDARRYDTLKALLDACDAELAMMAPQR